MPTTDMKFVKGLNIAIIILAALATLGSIVFTALVAAGGGALSDPSLYGAVFYEFADELDMYGPYYGGISDAGIVSGMFGIIFGLMMAVFIWCLICSAITVVSGVLGLHNAEKPEKLGGAFAWAIAGAVAALLSGRLITTALLVASAIFISRVRKGGSPSYTQAAYGYTPQPQYPYQPDYQQAAPTTNYQAVGTDYAPVYQQPQQPISSYAQPASYEQTCAVTPQPEPSAQPAPAYVVNPDLAAQPANEQPASSNNSADQEPTQR